MPVMRSMLRMLLPSASMETASTFFSVSRLFAITFLILLLLLTDIRIKSRYLLTIIMKKKAGRPKMGKQNAKGELFAARFTPPEAKQLNEAIRLHGQNKSDWLRKALLSAAGSDKSGS